LVRERSTVQSCPAAPAIPKGNNNLALGGCKLFLRGDAYLCTNLHQRWGKSGDTIPLAIPKMDNLRPTMNYTTIEAIGASTSRLPYLNSEVELAI
jgi:hypothetical protein